MDELRSLFREKFPMVLFGNTYYLYTDLTYIHDVERLEGMVFPNILTAELEITFAVSVFGIGIVERVERVLLNSDGTFIMEVENPQVKEVLKEWILLIKKKYPRYN